ncbi:hypothetical protein DM02DRAFT_271062 [Periconia macrospinosa]|uniref:Branchpoint-bridging protein n=1 Tax=Periconia macrospinosa TaxID=97972 RepID=A0A2V1D3K4_9PLEO|nr:hypothetical protein DM02DRAFT_271062 [Periconia macrospinosa]
METESGAKIAIRGKGSVKEGKGRSDAAHTSNQEEDLHCLIMADTEEKVNKAKKLIHNVIETLLLSPKGKTNSSVTSCVNLPLSTVPSETTKTRPARTVVKSVTVNTTVPRNRTSPPALSVVFVVKQATWLAIAPNASAEPNGATTTVMATATRDVLAAGRTSWTISSAKWVPTVDVQLELSNMETVEAILAMAMSNSATPSLGSVLQLALPPHGLATIATIGTTAILALDLALALPLRRLIFLLLLHHRTFLLLLPHRPRRRFAS